MITDSGTTVITGNMTVNAGTNNITLDNGSSTFGASVIIVGKNVAIMDTDAGGLDLGDDTTPGH